MAKHGPEQLLSLIQQMAARQEQDINIRVAICIYMCKSVI